MRLSVVRTRLAAGLAVLIIGASVVAITVGPAQAAIPNAWGFAYVTSPAAPSVPLPWNQSGSWAPPLKVTTMPGAVGQVFVTFPRIATFGGVVHVTAVSPVPSWCQAQGWGVRGPNEIVAVRCYHVGGVPAFTPFTVMYATSNLGPIPPAEVYGYAVFSPGHGLTASFNSRAGANTVVIGGVGVWVLTMHNVGPATVPVGGVQVTAVNAAVPAKCELNNWVAGPAIQVFQVRCFNAGAAPLNTGWALSYQRGRAITGTVPADFAYTISNRPLAAGPYVPVPAVNFNSIPHQSNKIFNIAAGLSQALLPGVGALPDNVLVSGFSTGPGFCDLTGRWTTNVAAHIALVRDVACYTAAGARYPFDSLITYTG